MARWHARPAYHARRVWALLILLDILPWPLGEDILAGMFMVVGLARPRRRRGALALAKSMGQTRPWRLAASLCAFLGRWVARMYLLGIRRPDDLRRVLVIEGAHHLSAVPGPAILLGFHLGLPSGDMIFACSASGDAPGVARLERLPRSGGARSGAPSRNRRRSRGPAVIATTGRPCSTRADTSSSTGERSTSWPTARAGRSSACHCRVGEFPIAAGWLTLHRLTGAPVIPVLHHLDGRRHVVHDPPAAAGRGSGPAGRPRCLAGPPD